jgi:putative membrane protein
MKSIILKIIIVFVTILIAANLAGVQITPWHKAFTVALVIGVLNVFLKPILMFFSLPFRLLTLGLFTFVINAVIVMIADYAIEGFYVPNFKAALIFSVAVSVVNFILTKIFR